MGSGSSAAYKAPDGELAELQKQWDGGPFSDQLNAVLEDMRTKEVPQIKEAGMHKLRELSRYAIGNGAEKKLMVFSKDCMDTILGTLRSSEEDASIQELGMEVLRNLSCSAEGAEADRVAEVDDVVVAALRTHIGIPSVQVWALIVAEHIFRHLQNFAKEAQLLKVAVAAMQTHPQDAAVQVQGFRVFHQMFAHRKEHLPGMIGWGGLDASVAALRSHLHNVEVQKYGLHSLRELAETPASELKEQLLAKGVVKAILGAMYAHPREEGLLSDAVSQLEALKITSATQEHKELFNGILAAMRMELADSSLDNRMKRAGFSMLCNLAVAATPEQKEHYAIDVITTSVELMKSHHSDDLQAEAIRMLGTFARSSATAAQKRQVIVDAIMESLKKHSSLAVQGNGLSTLQELFVDATAEQKEKMATTAINASIAAWNLVLKCTSPQPSQQEQAALAAVYGTMRLFASGYPSAAKERKRMIDTTMKWLQTGGKRVQATGLSVLAELAIDATPEQKEEMATATIDASMSAIKTHTKSRSAQAAAFGALKLFTSGYPSASQKLRMMSDATLAWLQSLVDDPLVQECGLSLLAQLAIAATPGQKEEMATAAIDVSVAAMAFHTQSVGTRAAGLQLLDELAVDSTVERQQYLATTALEASLAVMKAHPSNPSVQKAGLQFMRKLAHGSGAELMADKRNAMVGAILASLEARPKEALLALVSVATHATPEQRDEWRAKGVLEAILKALDAHTRNPAVQVAAIRTLCCLSSGRAIAWKMSLMLSEACLGALSNSLRSYPSDVGVQASGLEFLGNLLDGASCEQQQHLSMQTSAVELIRAAMAAMPDESEIQQQGSRALKSLGLLDAMPAAASAKVVRATRFKQGVGDTLRYSSIETFLKTVEPNPSITVQRYFAEEVIEAFKESMPRALVDWYVEEATEITANRVEAGLTKDLRAEYVWAIVAYTMDSCFAGFKEEQNYYLLLNEALRTRDMGVLSNIKHSLFFLVKGLQTLPVEDQKVYYRGIPSSEFAAIKEKYTSGTTIHWSGLTSASVDSDVALRFATKEGPGGVVFKINALTARVIGELSALPREREVILLPNFKAVVTDWLELPDSNVHQISLHEVKGSMVY